MEVWLAVSGMLALLGGGAGALAYYRNYTARTTEQPPPGTTLAQNLASNIASAYANGVISSTTPVMKGPLTYAQLVWYRSNGYAILGGDAYAGGPNLASGYGPVDTATATPPAPYQGTPSNSVDTSAAATTAAASAAAAGASAAQAAAAAARAAQNAGQV